MTLLYSGFGLTLAADRPIPGLIEFPGATAVDVEVCLDRKPSWSSEDVQVPETIRYASPYRDERGMPLVVVSQAADDTLFRLRFADGAEFVIEGLGERVWATASGTLAQEDVVSYLLGTVLGFVLRLRGVTCLHGSAIALADRAVAIIGPSGAGKSTTAGAFARQGYAVLADDIVPLVERGEEFLAQPGYPRLRLCPDALPPLSALARGRPPLEPPPGGRRLHLDLTRNGYRFQREPLPLAAVYILGERTPDPDAPCVEAVSARDRLLSLVANTYASPLLDGAMRAREFEVLARLAARVPVRRVRPHTDPAYLAALCDVIRRDCEARPCPEPVAANGKCGSRTA
jgi:hypothetical protein